MLLLIDENVPSSVTNYFRERGHDVRLVLDLFPEGTPDPVIAKIGDEKSAIVVTWNHKDFKKLAARTPKSGEQVLRRLGRINFRCPEPKGRKRVEALIEWIEFEHAQVQRLQDRRLMIEIRDGVLRIIR